MPQWALGYSGSTMSYTDAPDAQQRMGEFIERCSEHDILCDSFHLSSGYTSIGEKRYVFNWNREKFPDIDGFVDSYLEHGVRLCANIKPCLLQDHPPFDEVREAGPADRATRRRAGLGAVLGRGRRLSRLHQSRAPSTGGRRA